MKCRPASKLCRPTNACINDMYFSTRKHVELGGGGAERGLGPLALRARPAAISGAPALCLATRIGDRNLIRGIA